MVIKTIVKNGRTVTMVEPWVVHGTDTVVEPSYDGRFYVGFYIGKN